MSQLFKSSAIERRTSFNRNKAEACTRFASKSTHGEVYCVGEKEERDSIPSSESVPDKHEGFIKVCFNPDYYFLEPLLKKHMMMIDREHLLYKFAK